MDTLQITIQRKTGESYPVVVEYGASGAFLPVRTEGFAQIDPGALLPLNLNTHAYGVVLGQALFHGPIHDAFTRARAASAEQLRILLFVEPLELKSLRWERLCVPHAGQWDFAALDQRTPFSLYLPSLNDQRFPPIGRQDLRALVLVANPENQTDYNLEPFDAERTMASVRTALGTISCDMLAVGAGAVGLPTLDVLCERITAERYTLLHVVCHGHWQRNDGDTILYLADAYNQVAPVTATHLIERLRRVHGARGLPHLAFLATCESASPQAEGVLGGLAQRLVRELGMPAVIAMTETVTVETARRLWENFYERLRRHGQVDCALVEANAGLADRRDITVPALYSRLGERPLFSNSLDRPLMNIEIRLGLERLEPLIIQRAPVLREKFTRAANTLHWIVGQTTPPMEGNRSSLPDAGSAATRAARQGALNEINSLCVDILEEDFNALALGGQPSGYDERAPFRGLYPFGPEDSEFFFGRESLVARLKVKLAAHSFLAVLGPSGSGKSSLVMAGLVPALMAEQPGLYCAAMTPGREPLAQLDAVLARAPGEVAHPSPLASSTMLVVDQFEELFTLCQDWTARRTFLARLLALSRQQPVVLVMRADFWGECALYRGLKEAMQSHQELVAPMDANELRRAIELQAAKVGLRFEADLSNTLIDDVRGEPGAMPLLQHALLELWKRRHGRWLRAEEYRTLGGVQQAIAHTAEDVYERLSIGDKERVRNIFVRLTRLDAEPVMGEDHRDTRRRIGLEELVPAGAHVTATKALTRQLADARLIVTSVNPVTGREEVEVAHEALIRYWPRLRAWLDQDRVNLRLREGIREAAIEWQASRGDESLIVHRGSRLDEAAGLARQPRFALNELERAYIESAIALRTRERADREAQQARELEQAQARAEAEQQARREAEQRAESERGARMRQRRLSLGLAIFLFLALFAASFALQQNEDAKAQKAVAQTQGAFANQQKAVAQTQEAIANQQKVVAQTEEAFARSQQAQANAQSVEAERQRQIGLSRELAAISIGQLPADPELSLLLAMQAVRAVPNPSDRTFEAQDSLRQALDASYLYATLAGHTDVVQAAAISPDGRTLVTAGWDQTARVWEAPNGKLRCVIAPRANQIWSVTFSPHGDYILTAGDDGTARVWEATSCKLVYILAGHTDRVRSAAYSPNDQYIVTASDDQTVRIWDAATGQLLNTLRGHTDNVRSVAFSPDSQSIVTASWDQTARIWQTATGNLIATLRGHTGKVLDASFSPDGQYIVTASEDQTARIWGLDGGLRATLSGHTGPVWSARPDPTGRYIVTASSDHTARVWELPAGRPVTTITGHTRSVTSAVFSPDGQYVVTASDDRTARIWETSTGRPIAELRGHTDNVRSILYSPDGSYILTTSWDHTARIWRPPSDQVVVALRAHTDSINRAVFSPNGRYIVTASIDGTAHIWDTTNGVPVGGPLTHTASVQAAAWSPGDGKYLVTAGDDKLARVWAIPSQTLVATLQAPKQDMNYITDVAFSPDGNYIVTASADPTARIWDLRPCLRASLPNCAAPLYAELRGHTGNIKSVAFSPDGQTIVTASEDHTARVWAMTGAPRQELSGHQGAIWSAVFSVDGKYIVTASADSTARIWDSTTGRPLFVLAGHSANVKGAVFSPDGQYVATASDDRTARIWRVATGEQVAIMRGHTAPIWTVAFDPSSRYIITASSDRTARIWEVVTGALVTTLRGHADAVTSAVYSPDGKYVLTASIDGTALRYLAGIDDLLALADRRVTRALSCEEEQTYLHTQSACSPAVTPTGASHP
ncbi:MAG: CHAT domain-containing protein [Anaerolineae bacterium]